MHIVHGDLTTQKGIIRDNIANIVRNYANSTYLKKSDFEEVIHIVDMDGAYIPEGSITEDVSATDPIYSTSEIRTCNPKGIKSRNVQKRKNLDMISSLSSVWGGVKYHAYYMSCNLEHVLYNKINCSNQEKECNAYAFAKKYKSDSGIFSFISFIADSDFAVSGSYAETWMFIRKDKHSLERFTNLGICFRAKKSEQQDDCAFSGEK